MAGVAPAGTHVLVAMTYFCALGTLVHCTARTVPSGSRVQPSSEFRSRLVPPLDQVLDSGSQIAVACGNELVLGFPSRRRPSGMTHEEASPMFVQPTGVAMAVQTSVVGRRFPPPGSRFPRRRHTARPRSI